MAMGRKRKANKHLPPRVQVKSGTYYHTPFIGGKTRWVRIGKTYAEAMARYAELEGFEQQRGNDFNSLITEYTLRVQSQHSEKTIKNNNEMYPNLRKTFGDAPLDQLKPEHFARYRDLNGHRKIACNREIQLAGRILQRGIEWGWLRGNNPARIRLHPEEKRDRYITDKEFAALFLAANPTARVVMMVGYATGLRIGDVLDLRLTDLRDGALPVVQMKNKARGTYPIKGALADALHEARAIKKTRGSIYVVSRRDGLKMTYSGWHSMWDRTCKRAKVEDAHFHDIRAKAVTDFALETGKHPQEFSLHRSRKQAEDYVKAREIPVVEPLDFRIILENFDLYRKKDSREHT